MRDTKSAVILTTLLASLWVLAFTVRSEGFDITYNSNAEQLLFTSSDAPPLPPPFGAGACPDCPFTLTNNTGTIWTDFHFRLAQGQGPPGQFFFVTLADPFDGDGYEGPGNDTFSEDLSGQIRILDVVSLNIADDGTYSFTVDMAAFELQETYQLFGTPTTDGGNGRVPLPGTFLLLAVGLAGSAIVARKRRRRD